jgi:DNA-binding NtrC family response regulator
MVTMARLSHLPLTPPRAGAQIASESPKVLIVHEDVRALRASFLRSGWQVTAAARVREALMVLSQLQCQLVVCGIAVPESGVCGVLDHLHKIGSSTPVVVLADDAQTLDMVKAVRSGAFDFYLTSQPFEELQSIAQRALQLGATAESGPTKGRRTTPELPSVDLNLSDLNRIHLEDALHLASGNRTRAAEMLGISVRTVRNKIRQYGLPSRSHA